MIARALIVAVMAQRTARDQDLLSRLSYRYLGFLQHAFNPDTGRFRNFMTYDRRWLEDVGSEDSHGRALWALGFAAQESPRLSDAAAALFDRALPVMADIAPLRAPAEAARSLHGPRAAPGHQADAEALRLPQDLRRL